MSFPRGLRKGPTTHGEKSASACTTGLQRLCMTPALSSSSSSAFSFSMPRPPPPPLPLQAEGPTAFNFHPSGSTSGTFGSGAFRPFAPPLLPPRPGLSRLSVVRAGHTAVPVVVAEDDTRESLLGKLRMALQLTPQDTILAAMNSHGCDVRNGEDAVTLCQTGLLKVVVKEAAAAADAEDASKLRPGMLEQWDKLCAKHAGIAGLIAAVASNSPEANAKAKRFSKLVMAHRAGKRRGGGGEDPSSAGTQ